MDFIYFFPDRSFTMGRMKSKGETRVENKLFNCQKKLEATIKEKNKISKEVDKLKKDIKFIEVYKTRSKDYLSKLKKLSAELEREKKSRRKWGEIDFFDQQIDGHKYPENLVKLVGRFVIEGGNSWRKSVKILEIINEEFNLQLPSIPCYSSVRNWLVKSGYAIYNESPQEEYSDDYACIVDESMMVGGQKLLLTLGVPALKESGDKLFKSISSEFLRKKLNGKLLHGRASSALTFGDIKVLDMSVASRWNGDSIGETLDKVASKVGSSPSYVISDNASIMNKGIRDKNHIQIEDVGHSVSLCVERVYKDDGQFIDFEKETASVKFRKVMCSVAYLLSPKQRTVARFMNLSSTVNWASSMLHALPCLDKESRSIFSFLSKYKDMIISLQFLFVIVNGILKYMKEQGLSKRTIESSFIEIGKLQKSSIKSLRLVGDGLAKLFEGYRKKLPDNKEVEWHCSSDIIESLFGYYKSIKSPNKMNGVTSQIFLLPLKVKMCSHKSKDMSFKKYLESTTLAEINQWTKKHLPLNQVVKRIKTLKKQTTK
jgi:hypothetical protein